MERGQEETSTSQAGRRQGPSRELPSTSSIISSLSIDEVRSYCQIPEDIDFELSEARLNRLWAKNITQCFSLGNTSQSGFAFPYHP